MFVLSLIIGVAACGGGSSVTNVVEPPPPDTNKTPPPVRHAAFDLRFKGVGVLSSNVGLGGENIDAGPKSALNISFANASGTPLEIGPGNCSPTACAWFVNAFELPSGMDSLNVFYTGSIIQNLPELVDALPTDTVVTSLDVQRAVGAYGASEYITDTLGGYHAKQAVVAPADFAEAVSADGAAGRVVTAVSFDADSVRFVSYTWPNDSGAVYDVAVSDTTMPGVAAAAQALVGAGYVITAFGGNVTNGFLLVGTRVHGTSAQHSLIVGPTSVDLTGYAVVGYVLDSLNSPTILFER